MKSNQNPGGLGSVALEALSSVSASPGKPSAADDGSHERQNKTIRIRKSFNERLRDATHAQSKAQSKKVTESDIIDAALVDWFAKQDRLNEKSKK